MVAVVEVMLDAINALQSLTCFTLLLSWKIGEAIISTFWLFFHWTLALVRHTQGICRVLLEDFYIFLSDLSMQASDALSMLHVVLDGSSASLNAVFRGVKFIFCSAYLFSNTIWSIFTSSVAGILNAAIQSIILTKHLLILFGSGVWFLITFVPLTIFSIINLSLYYLKGLLKKLTSYLWTKSTYLWKTLVDIYEFITDVPVEAVCGIIAAVCILYLLFYFHLVLYRFSVLKMRTFVELVRTNLLSLTTRINFVTFTQINASNRNSTESDGNVSNDEDVIDDRYCVICQERYKCILILPCKHVCICSECNLLLRGYNRQCPMCRSNINKTMKVFV